MGHTTPVTSPFAETTLRRRPHTSPKFEEGTLVGGRYRLGRFLARGGMAEVWLATHESLKCDVAIKFIDHKLVYAHEARALERFRMEAQVSARLGTRTKHIVAVQDADEHEGLPYLVMEFVPGHTLENELEQRGPLDPARLADLLDQAADALSAAHALGIVHRDLKPSNLMLIDEPSGATMLKVSDFGIAKALRSDLPVDRPKETNIGQLVGSPAYMSPEQIDGRKDLNARTDLWSLGALCYEALTGRTCFDSKSLAELLQTISAAKYTPVSRVRPALPKALDAWFARTFSVAPEDRWSSAVEMAQAFRAAIASKKRARPVAVWIVAGGAALVVGGVLLAISMSHSSTTEAAPRPTVSVVITNASADTLPAPLPVEAPAPQVAPVVSTDPEPTWKAQVPRTKPSASAAPSAIASATPIVSAAPIVSVSVPSPPPSTKPPVKKVIDQSEIQ